MRSHNPESFLKRVITRPWILCGVLLLVTAAAMVVSYYAAIKDLNSPSERWSILLAVGQFVTGVLLIPVAIFGFEIARREFESAQARPDLDLQCRNPAGPEATGEVAVHPKIVSGVASFTLELEIKNMGDAIADAYMVELSGLDALCVRGSRNTFEWNEELGDRRQDWKDEVEESGRLIFFSRNSSLLFPTQTILFCTMTVNVTPDALPGRVVIPYRVYFGHEAPTDETLRLKIVKPPASQVEGVGSTDKMRV